MPVDERTNVEAALLDFASCDRNEHQSSYKVRQHLPNRFHSIAQQDAHEFWMDVVAEMNDVVWQSFQVEVSEKV